MLKRLLGDKAGWKFGALGLLAVSLLASISLLRLGRTQGGPVELTARRTLQSKTFRHPNGSFTLRTYNGPIHYHDATGGQQDIDGTLRS